MENDNGQEEIERAEDSWYPHNRQTVITSDYSHPFDNDATEINDSNSEKTYQDEPEFDRFKQLKHRILDDFKRWLDQLDEDELTEIEEATSEDNSAPDLQDFFGELAALRQEVRLQSKSNQTIGQNINELSSSLESSLDNSIQNVANAVSDIKRQVPEARRDAQRSIAVEFLSVIEGLERSFDSVSEDRLPSLMIGKAMKKKFIQNLVRPYKLLLSKGLDSLARLKIQKIAAIGDNFDSKSMRVVGTTQNTGATAGTVTEVCLQGYLIENSLIRTAEVKVEK